MPDREREEDTGFKVTDRRLFTADGQRRTEVEAEAPKPEPPPSPPKSSSAQATADQGRTDRPRNESPRPGPASFEQLVMSLATTAMFQLGLMPGPGGERIPADMPNAQRTVDLLQVLQEKTTGNLTPNESRLLDEVLYELRMTFVELQKRQARKG